MDGQNWQRWLKHHNRHDSEICQDNGSLYWIKNRKRQQINWFDKHRPYHQIGMSKKQHKLIQAIHGRMTVKPIVFDACAGLGYDTFLMSLSGCDVIACEKNASIFALLADMHAKANNQSWLGQGKIKIIFGCAVQIMHEWPEYRIRPDVVYLDPMFDKDFKGEVKANAALLKSLVAVENTDQLFKLALSTARYKVVVKRPLAAKPLSDSKPTYTIQGKTTRYDVYQVG